MNKMKTMTPQGSDPISPAQTRQSIFVHGLTVMASIGVHPHEHETQQEIIIDIDLDVSAMPPPREDKLEETLDYSLIAKAAEDISLAAHVQLVETLAARIAEWALAFDPRVQAVRVKISKPQALYNADAAGVEIMRTR